VGPGILFLALFMISLKWVKDKPDQLFWLSLILYFDPGGYFAGLIGMDVIFRLKYYDFLMVFMFAAYLGTNDHSQFFKSDRVHKRIFIYLITISLFFLLITGIIVPMLHGYFNFTMFLQKNRQFFYGLPIFFFVFHFAFRNAKVFYKYLVYSSAIILTLYFITLITGLDLMPIEKFSRYTSNDRISMISYGISSIILPLGLVVISYGRKLKIPNRKLLIYSMILMFLATLITLTRREIISLLFMLVAIPYLTSRLTHTVYFGKLLKYAFPVLTVGFLVMLFFPTYLDLLSKIVSDTTSILITGQDTRGVEEYRVKGTGDMLLVKEMISKNPLVGIGYYPADWSDIVNMQSAGNEMGFVLDASGEVPIYGALLRLGVIGLIIPLFLYFLLIKLWFRVMKFLKSNIGNLLNYPVEIAITTYVLYYFLAKVIISPYSLFVEFYDPTAFNDFLLTLGLLLGVITRLRYITSKS
jgi:hypothetical protein